MHDRSKKCRFVDTESGPCLIDVWKNGFCGTHHGTKCSEPDCTKQVTHGCKHRPNAEHQLKSYCGKPLCDDHPRCTNHSE